MKKCKTCGEEKEISEFYKKGEKQTFGDCKVCYLARYREAYAKRTYSAPKTVEYKQGWVLEKIGEEWEIRKIKANREVVEIHEKRFSCIQNARNKILELGRG